MTSLKKEIAKFLCGAEASHAIAHAVLLLSGTTITVFGIDLPPTWNIVPLTVVILITLALGSYGWGIYRQRKKPGE